MNKSIRKVLHAVIIVLTVIGILNPVYVKANTSKNVSSTNISVSETRSTVAYYLPYRPSVAPVRISQTGTLYINYYAQIGYPTVYRSVCTGVDDSFCVGGDGDFHVRNDKHPFERGAIDFSLAEGTDVLASASGYIYDIQWSVPKTVAIRHPENGTISYYVHVVPLSTLREGAFVSQGEKIAEVSSKEDGTTGAHLHFSVYKNSVEIMVPFADADAYQYGSYLGYLLPSRSNYIETRYQSDNGTATPPPPPTNKTFSNGSSSLSITQSAVNLTVCGDNLAGQTVYATLYRNAVGSDLPTLWTRQKTATSTCTTFSDMDGAGDTYANVTYYTVASLNPISDSDAMDQRTACYSATGGEQLCDAIQRESNIGTAFSGGVSDLTITQTAVGLEVCASNLSGKTVYATLYRDAYASYSARTWRYQKTASSSCVTFADMDGAGDTFTGITYYTVASLNPISDSDATSKRTACYDATGGQQLCDAGQRSYSGTLFDNGYSRFEITQAEVNLLVCADNLSGKNVKATLYRDAYDGNPARIWRYDKTATSGCVTFSNMEGAGDTFSGITYYTVASLNTISDSDASSKRTACYDATGGAQLCDAGIRGTTPQTCYALTTNSSPIAGGGVVVSPSSSGGCAAGTYISGTTVSLTANPASGYTFQSWSGASGGSTTSITITGTKSVTAYFTTAEYNSNWMPDNVFTGELDTQVSQIRNFLSEQGSCLANPLTDVDGQTIDVPALIIQAAQRYDINPKVILATMQKEQSAITKCPSSYGLSALMGAGSPSTAREQIDFGTSLFRAYLTELANNGVTRSGWKVNIPKTTVDGVTVTPASRAVAALFTYTPYAGVAWGGNMSTVGGTQLFKASWERFNFDEPFLSPNCYSLLLSIDPNNGGFIVSDPEPNCSSDQYYEETDVTVWVMPYDGFKFDSWYGGISSENLVLDFTINSNMSLTAKFVAANTPPTFTSTPITIGEQGVLYTYSITSMDADDDDALTLSAPTKPNWLTLEDNGDGTGELSGTPSNPDVGEHNVELLVNDSHGGVDTQTFTIIVQNNNDAPVFTSDPILSGQQGSLYQYEITATDPDSGDLLSFSAMVKPDWLTLVDNGDNSATLSGTPSNSDIGSHQVILRVLDSAGLSDEQSFTIEVDNVNDQPEAYSQVVDVAYETAALITLQGYDPDGDELVFSIVDLPQNGSISGVAPNITYTPKVGYSGSDSFSFTVYDGEFLSNIAQITIIIGGKSSNEIFIPLFVR